LIVCAGYVRLIGALSNYSKGLSTGTEYVIDGGTVPTA
jgi:hypothetical protein